MTSEMREPTYLVLTALAAGRRHGYGVIQDIERFSGGKVRLRPGSLYATLDRLVAEQLVETVGEEVVDGRARRYYELTATGATALAEESERRLVMSKEALRRLRVSGALA